MPGASSIVSDCQSVQQDCGRGLKWASAPNRHYARSWVSIASATDEGENPVPITWMPAHTAEADVGHLVKSDGCTLTLQDRNANDKADLLAKAAAIGRRHSRTLRETIQREAAEVAGMAVWLAKATQHANHFPCDDGHVRDSDAVARKQKGAKRKCDALEALDKPGDSFERLLKIPRLEALRARVLAKTA